MKSLYSTTKYLTLIPIFGCLIACITLLVLSLFKMFYLISHIDVYLYSIDKGKELIVALVEVVDIFLISTVFYIVFLGLYELFIDNNVQTPKWLNIESIDDLKKKLISAIVLVISVYFLSVLENPQIARYEMTLIAIGISFVIFALSYFIAKK